MKRWFLFLITPILISATPMAAFADVSGLTPCKDSAVFKRRLDQSVKKLSGRLSNYDEGTPLSDDANEKSPTRQETYSTGDAFLATPNTWHYSSNQGDEELIFMISWFGEDSQPVRVDE